VVLQQRAFDFARRLLKPNGYFLCKLFQGQDSFEEMRSSLQSFFSVVHLIKPSASRIESSEMYLLAMQYRGDTSNQSTKTDNKDENEIERLLAEARRVRTKKKDK
jgi:23S rRNA (uridine2552-2'-O)-methyltransferase